MVRKALIVVLVYEISMNNLTVNSRQWKQVVDCIFEQLQNNYQFNNALFKLIVCWDLKVRQIVIIISKILQGKFQ